MNETCEGCGHALSWHYYDVQGIARCRDSFENSLTDSFPCDCAGLKSEIKALRDAKRAREEAERNRIVDRIAGVAKEALAKAERLEGESPKLCTTSGEPVDKVRAEQTEETGMHKSYIVLCPDERAKGFVRPVRRAYVHLKCGTVTTMGQSIAETYARDPFFYSATFCCACNAHLPVGEDGEFVWDGSTEKVGT